MTDTKTEISFEVDASEAAVLDGYCQAHNIKRTVVMRKLLKEWSEIEHRAAIMICRVAGSKPDAIGLNRSESV